MSLYEVLKASKTERFPDYWTLLWGRKLSASMIKTITGVLPLTFTAKGGTAADWVIYGNDDNGTENLADVSKSGMVQINAGGDMRYGLSLGKLEAGNYTVVYTSELVMYTTKRLYNNTYTSAPAPSGTVITITSNIDELIFRTTSATETTWEAAGVSDIMIVKGSTAPDHYIPYQQGVGERTKNLLDIVTISGTRYDVTYITNKTAGTYTLNGTATNSYFSDIATFIAEAGKAYVLSGCAEGGGSSSYQLYTRIDNTNYLDKGDGVTLPILDTDTTITIRIAVYSGAVCDNVVMKPMVREANTSDTFIPYGYQIPLTVSQQGQPDKTYDIYIGDTPLTEGQQVSKTSIGQDIELFEGKNTVSTTLYNKPEMEIKYL